MDNATIIAQELQWLNLLIQKRIESYFQNESKGSIVDPPKIQESYYKAFIDKNKLDLYERKIILLGLATEISPNSLDIFLTKNKLYDMPFSEFGGIPNSNYNSFVPTIQTALFLTAADDKSEYIEVLKLFDTSNKLFKNNILESDHLRAGVNLIHTKLSLTKNSLNLLLYGKDIEHEFSVNFPAKLLSTKYEWDDLVLSDYTMEHLKELDMWLDHGEVLLDEWDMSKYIQKGYKALFYGSSGTGKTLTVSLLGKKFNKKVYRVDLSQIVSKYIGETEKNLEKIFNSAQEKDWILFFDEADSLFGKRTQISSSNDKYANQETAYLLQRVEECSNLVILATNLKDNFDDAFLRRFQSIIYFPLPDEHERLRLWKKGFSKKADLGSVDLESISNRFELTGANIMNVIRTVSLMAISRSSTKIEEEDIITGIRREKYKEGKII
ncbi:MAG: ATP-binding protein [Campylobacterota bacterium]|nr:ATP-binding protein [Campylobacterota bacterium]